ncbi:MAG: hypothetical protein HY261_01525 [Chloroflexi bacterium]|nr:hypothetical protein [Chloroflexota bacterium]
MFISKVRGGAFAAISLAVILTLSACGGGGSNATATPNATQAPRSSPTAAATSAPQPTATPAPTPTPQPRRGGVLVMRLAQGWQIRDTYDARGGFAQVLTSSMTNTLVTTNPYNFKSSEEIIGDLARTWEVSADGLTYTFKLNPGVAWHDGTPFTAKDVVYSFNRGINPPAPQVTFNRNRLANVAKIEAPDDATVVITGKVPSASFLRGLSMNFMQIMPSHIPDMGVWNTKVTGTGPFKLKTDRPTEVVEVERNAAYWKKDGAGQALPYLDGLTYFIISDATNAYAAFRTGRIRANPGTYDSDWAPQHIPEIQADFPGINQQKYTSSRWDVLINSNNPSFQDLRVRQAVSLALSRQDFDKEGAGVRRGE